MILDDMLSYLNGAPYSLTNVYKHGVPDRAALPANGLFLTPGPGDVRGMNGSLVEINRIVCYSRASDPDVALTQNNVIFAAFLSKNLRAKTITGSVYLGAEPVARPYILKVQPDREYYTATSAVDVSRQGVCNT